MQSFSSEKMAHGIKMMVDPMSRYMTEGQEAQKALGKLSN